jgi:hypothetical protein
MKKNNIFCFLFCMIGIFGLCSYAQAMKQFCKLDSPTAKEQEKTDERPADLVSLVCAVAPYGAAVIQLGLPFDFENGVADSSLCDAGAKHPDDGLPRSAYVSSGVKAAVYYGAWYGIKRGFKKMTGHP